MTSPIPKPTQSKHEECIQHIAAKYGAKRGKFSQTVRDLLEPDFTHVADREWLEDALKVNPDAWDVEPDVRVITVFEIEDTYPVRTEKMAKLVRLMWALDYFEWALQVIAVDIWHSERVIDPLQAFELLKVRDGHYATLSHG